MVNFGRIMIGIVAVIIGIILIAMTPGFVLDEAGLGLVGLWLIGQGLFGKSPPTAYVKSE